ncbi:Helix-turn-helix domain-containing protein [Cyclobacterium lianum]|uniref:Helix-turn-helix domain-containing protein n=1 Tax=Cyclobacterium lianum TaxID=388280 RepID=A0A1M7MH21_9BACT|nr:AraC family transcriptional regulator [Cyclobacterium lianum]SHM90200.1 Helix-turn-helix domain-containing protein [Cyclobacterium lianum]
MTTTLHIKNMVCPRCILVVENELKALGVDIKDVKLGYAQVVLPQGITLPIVDDKLKEFGFELIFEADSILAEEVKTAVLAYLKHIEQEGKEAKKLSDFISSKIGKNYNYISKIFSKQTGHTLEKYYILLRVEKVKELLDYAQLNVSEIALQLGYSSVHYLSNQFRRITGLSISDYKKRIRIDRGFLDDL